MKSEYQPLDTGLLQWLRKDELLGKYGYDDTLLASLNQKSIRWPCLKRRQGLHGLTFPGCRRQSVLSREWEAFSKSSVHQLAHTCCDPDNKWCPVQYYLVDQISYWYFVEEKEHLSLQLCRSTTRSDFFGNHGLNNSEHYLLNVTVQAEVTHWHCAIESIHSSLHSLQLYSALPFASQVLVISLTSFLSWHRSSQHILDFVLCTEWNRNYRLGCRLQMVFCSVGIPLNSNTGIAFFSHCSALHSPCVFTIRWDPLLKVMMLVSSNIVSYGRNFTSTSRLEQWATLLVSLWVAFE